MLNSVLKGTFILFLVIILNETTHHGDLIQAALDTLVQNGSLPKGISPSIMVENTRDKSHGDLASNIAMTLAKTCATQPT